MIEAMDNPAAGVLFWLGALAIVAIFGGITYRVGKFVPSPGEWGRVWLNWGAVLVGGLALTAAIPVAKQFLGWDAQLTVIAFLSAIGVGLLLTRGRRARAIAAALAKQSPEVQAEYARRTAFLRSGRGRLLTVAMLACVVVWAAVLAFVNATPPSP
jgi:hypothetical protein